MDSSFPSAGRNSAPPPRRTQYWETFGHRAIWHDGWRAVTLFNPVVYLISGFRWAFYGQADVHIGVSTAMTLVFMSVCLGVVYWVFKTGHRIRR